MLVQYLIQLVTVSIRDVGGLDDNPDTGTGTNTDTRTEGSDTDSCVSNNIILQITQPQLNSSQNTNFFNYLTKYYK